MRDPYFIGKKESKYYGSCTLKLINLNNDLKEEHDLSEHYPEIE